MSLNEINVKIDEIKKLIEEVQENLCSIDTPEFRIDGRGRYKTRAGHEVIIYTYIPRLIYPWRGVSLYDAELKCWKENGKYITDEPSVQDIIEKLEAYND